MSQEKIKEILIALQDSESINPNAKRERFMQALAEINRIVMECLPKKKETKKGVNRENLQNTTGSGSRHKR